jgi:ABC-type transport system involved in multi-copper enzyme maturation permease subunit
MLRRLFHLLGGPVLHRELVRATRWPGPQLLVFAYVVWLFFQSLVFWSERDLDDPFVSNAAIATVPGNYGISYPSRYFNARERMELNRLQLMAGTDKVTRYVRLLLYQQLILLGLLTPIITAGAIVYEKERDTLLALFGTELGAGEIVIGKLLGRLIALGRGASVVVPALVCSAVIADIPLVRLGLALAQAAILTFCLAAACLLVSLWTRRTIDAIIGSYSALIVGYLVVQLILSSLLLPDFLNPVAIVNRLLKTKNELQTSTIVMHLAFWAALGTLFLGITTLRLRPVCLGLIEKRPGRWLWAYRTRMGDNPVRWREQHVLGLSPLPVLRMIPGWMGHLGVLTFALLLAGDALADSAGRSIFERLGEGDFGTAYTMIQNPSKIRLWADLNLMGGALVVFGSIAVGVRCALSIAEEKRRKTWEDLILTPLTLGDIVIGKFVGIIAAAALPLAIYSLPMFALSTLSGLDGVEIATIWVAAACIVIPLVGWMGINLAAQQELADSQVENPAGTHSLKASATINSSRR